MYRIEYYVSDNGTCDVQEWLAGLEERQAFDKDARVQLQQANRLIRYLIHQGTFGPENIVKHLDEDIWELRPGNNRVVFFHFERETIVLLHHFRKTTHKTPRSEIDRAKRERDAYKRQQGG